MTPSLASKLSLIRTACQRAIDLGEKATPGPWSTSDYQFIEAQVQQDAPRMALCDTFRSESNASFIAHSRSFSPAAARALLNALDTLSAIWEVDQKVCGFTESAAGDALSSLITNFPEDAL